MPASSLPPNMIITLTEGSNTYTTSLPCIQSSITTNRLWKCSNYRWKLYNDYSSPNEDLLLEPVFKNIGSSVVNFQFPNLIGGPPPQTIALQPSASASLQTQMTTSSTHSSMIITFTEGSNTFTLESIFNHYQC